MLAVGLLLALLVIILDQLTKSFVVEQFTPGSEVTRPVTSYFNLVQVGNRGVSFGMFDGTGNGIVFSAVALVISAFLVFWLARTQRPLMGIGIGLIIGGALGNVIDRVRLGYVVDFLDFHLGTYHWPSFNVADSAICVGVALLMIDGFRDRPSERQRLETSQDELAAGELISEENSVLMAAEQPKVEGRRTQPMAFPDSPETGLLLRPGRPMKATLTPAAGPPPRANAAHGQVLPPEIIEDRITRPGPTVILTEHDRSGHDGIGYAETGHDSTGRKHLRLRPESQKNGGGPHGA